MKKAILYLIPNTLGDTPPGQVIPSGNYPLIHNLRYFFVENLRNARRFLLATGMPVPLEEITFLSLTKHSSPGEIEACLHVLLLGQDAGVISEAGMPAVADPGAPLVRLAHQHGIRVRPLSGPSSISLAVSASGMTGQRFSFHGYLPIPEHEREKAIRSLEQESAARDMTQAFMETPYRNMALLESILKVCQPDTLLCVACDLSLETEWIRMLPVAEWKKEKPALHKRPAIFLLYRKTPKVSAPAKKSTRTSSRPGRKSR